MSDNVLTKVVQQLSSSLSNEEIHNKVSITVNSRGNMHSYLIRAKYADNKLQSWLIDYVYSQYEQYNTLLPDETIKAIVSTLIDNRNTVQSVIGYKQPSLELMIILYDPLIRKLATQQAMRWPDLEYEDAYSMCQLSMVKLYRKGYYIHKGLLKRSFENDVLMHLRKNRNKPEIISLTRILYNNGNDGELTAEDMLPDREEEHRREDKDEVELLNNIFNEVKDILISFIGERQFDQLFRDYGQKHTTSWSRKKMQDIKNKFKKLGITWKSFEKYL